MLPLISIITPSYNQGQYIEQTILSVIEQGYENYELIIIDGGSTDNTLQVIKKYESFITYWVSEPDNGQADAINKGLAKAGGEVFNWINSDDYLEPGALKHVGEYFYNNPDKMVLCGYTRCFYDADNSTSHIYRMGIQKTVTDTVLKVEMNQPGTFYRMEAVRVLKGVNTSLRYVFDCELWYRLLHLYGLNVVGKTDTTLAQFRLHKSSKSVLEGFDLFDQEAKNISLHLVKQFKIDTSLIALLYKMQTIDRYETEHWHGRYINAKILNGFWAYHFMLSVIEEGNYITARKGLLYMLKSGGFTLSRKNVSAFFKLFVFPGYLK